MPETEAKFMRKSPEPGVKIVHYLPANFVLKTQGTPQARLVLNPSGLLNQTLSIAPNLEQNISAVMCKIQATPIIFLCDIREAFFRILHLVHEGSSSSNMFLMDFNSQANQLSSKSEPNSELVTVRTLVKVMEILQSPAFLGLCRKDPATDLENQTLHSTVLHQDL